MACSFRIIESSNRREFLFPKATFRLCTYLFQSWNLPSLWDISFYIPIITNIFVRKAAPLLLAASCSTSNIVVFNKISISWTCLYTVFAFTPSLSTTLNTPIYFSVRFLVFLYVLVHQLTLLILSDIKLAACLCWEILRTSCWVSESTAALVRGNQTARDWRLKHHVGRMS